MSYKVNNIKNIHIIYVILTSRMTIVDEYLYYHEKYTKKYGSKTLVLMQVGSFHEAYSTDTRGYNLEEITELLDIILTKKDKTCDQVNESNPYMAGVPSHSLMKYLNILMNNGYTVVIVDQVTPPPKPRREVTGIYSSGTYIEESFTPDSNNIVCLYIEDEQQRNGSILMCIGMSVIDLSTGENTVHESFSISGDERYALDEASKFINSYKPKEILIYRKDPTKKFNDQNKFIIGNKNFILYLELESKNYNFFSRINKNFFKINYQNEFFGKIFKDTGMLQPIEYLDMEKKPYARISYIILLDFAYQHNENIINNIYKPKIFQNSMHLYLGNNAILQLNVSESDLTRGFSNKYKSLFDVVNNTSTPIGRRYLKSILNAPLVNPKKIEESYNYIADFIDQPDLTKSITNCLKGIGDLERLQRKISLKMIHPINFADVISSYENVKMLIDNINKNNKSKNLKKILPDKVVTNSINKFLEYCDKLFIKKELELYYINEIKNSIFKTGFFEDIDKIQKNINNGMAYMENITTVLSSYIKEINKKNKKKSKIDKNETKVYLKRNDRDGYYLYLTKLRAKLLKEQLKNIDKIKITDDLTIRTKDLVFKDQPKSGTKIFIKDLSDKSNNITLWREQIMNLVKDRYVEELEKIYGKYKGMFKEITTFVARIDFAKSGAVTATLYNYAQPQLVVNSKTKKRLDYGFIRCDNLRHPIIERINTDYEYIPHNINLGRHKNDKKDKWDLDGILLYGLNSAGKSTIMKAIGLSIIMAQCGMYVPATKFVYSPYESLFTRITGNDNIFKGLSSFSLEMTELRAILRRSGPKTLVIGDEVCRGTEHISGNSIVAATIINLSKTGPSFIFATHLHEIVKMERIKNLKNVKPFHLSVEYDDKKDELIFDRKLKPGTGSSIYGITVAKYIIHDKEFMKLAQEIKNELMKMPNVLLNDKKSRYNSEVFIDKCGICGIRKDISGYYETHHINHQKDCDKQGFVKSKPHIQKNSKSNLVPLCEDCHKKVHHGKLKIDGYLCTSSGKKLDYSLIKESNKKNQNKKYGPEEIKKIKDIKQDGISLRKAKLLLEKKYDMKIGLQTIKKIWDGVY